MRTAVSSHSVRPCVALSGAGSPGLCGSRTAPGTSAWLIKPAPPAPRTPRSPARAGSTPGLGAQEGVLAGRRGSRRAGGSRFRAASRALAAERCNPPGNISVLCNATHCRILWEKPRTRRRLSDRDFQYQLQVQQEVRMRAAACGAPRPEDPGPGTAVGAGRLHGGAASRGGSGAADTDAAATNARPQSPAAREGSRGQCSERPPRDSPLGAGAAGGSAVLRVRGQDRKLTTPGTSGSSRHVHGFQKQA